MTVKSIILVPTSNYKNKKLMDTRLLDDIVFKAISVANIHINLFYQDGDKPHPLESEIKYTLKHNRLDGSTIKQIPCGVDSDSMVILWNGDKLPCINTTMVVGNVQNDGLNTTGMYDQCEQCPFREVKDDRILEMQ